MATFVDETEFETETCCACGMAFAMTRDFRQRKLKNKGSTFYCPAGHAQHYTGKTEEQKLRQELERKQRELEAHAGRAAVLENQRDELARSYGRMRERVKNGLCPCCDRTFQNLLDHMKTQHPEYGEHQQLKILRDTFGLTQHALAQEIGIPANYISMFEREKPVPSHAEMSIKDWAEKHFGVES